MSDLLPDETRVATEIDRLKIEFPKTRELYREVCALLFFRFGITPTANRLYQLVKRGSMSTPTQVLGEFWAELRDKSRVRIEHPDLPADLQGAAGELIATLWGRATASAQQALDALRVETEAEKATAQAAVTSAQTELARTETALEQRTSALLTAQVRIQELEQALAAADATRRAIEAEVARQQEEIGARNRALVQARADFSGELEKLRAGAELEQERLRAAEKRALVEIDRERATSSRLQKELEAVTRKGEQRDAAHRDEIQMLQAQLGDMRHRAGVVEGTLEALRSSNAIYAGELDALRLQLSPTAANRAQTRKRPISSSGVSTPRRAVSRITTKKRAGA